MLPVDNVYGPWPLSGQLLGHPEANGADSFTGEIDLTEGRGNGPSYPHRLVSPYFNIEHTNSSDL
jgi:hypothetical protein